MKKLAIAFIALNILDILLTLHFVSNGTSTELNPLMAVVIRNPGLAILYKVVVPIVIAGAVLVLNWHPRAKPLKRYINWERVMTWLVALEAGICLFNLSGLAFGGAL